MSRPVGSKNKSTIAKEKQSATAPVMSIEELEALRDSKYDEWESAPKGMAKAKLMNELEDIEAQLEAAQSAVNSSGASIADIDRAVKNAMSEASREIADLRGVIGDLTQLVKTLTQEITAQATKHSAEIADLKATHSKEVASLKADIAALNAAHDAQVKKLTEQIGKVEKLSGVAAMNSNRTQATSKVDYNGEKITIAVDYTSNPAELKERLDSAVNEVHNRSIKEQFERAVTNVFNSSFSGTKWEDLDDDYKNAILNCDRSGNNAVYDEIKSRGEGELAESIQKQMEEEEAHTVDSTDLEPDMLNASDVTEIDPDEFEEIFGG